MKNILLIVMIIFLLIVISGCSLYSKINENNSISTADSGTNNFSVNTNKISSIPSNINKQSTAEKLNPTATPSVLVNEQGGDSTLENLQKQGLEVMEEQSFWIDLENWGRVRFVTGEIQMNGLPKLSLYLVDSNDNVLYSFPDFYGNMWILYEVKAISFKDVNKDGLKDIIVIADYILGHGENAAVPFPVGGIYFQTNNEFVTLPELDTEINEKKQNESIDMILKYVKGKDIKINK